MFIKLKSKSLIKTVAYIKNTCKKFDADDSFMNFHFLENALDYSYRAERQIDQFAGYFTVLAIFISCLGLFGLASFMAQQRTREIGIRKALGASVPAMVFMLSKDFTKWVIISNIFAWPAAYFTAQKMLHRFAYRIDIGLEIFIFSGIAALVIALLTVSSQAIRTAQSNPVESLRYE